MKYYLIQFLIHSDVSYWIKNEDGESTGNQEEAFRFEYLPNELIEKMVNTQTCKKILVHQGTNIQTVYSDEVKIIKIDS